VVVGKGGAVSSSSPIIDVHTHVVPHGLPFGHDDRFAAFVEHGDTADVLVGGAHFRTVPRESWDVDARVASMDAGGIAVQAISVMPELFSYWAEPDLGRKFCRSLNEAVATMATAAPDRLVGLGIVPLQDVDAAIAALDDVRELGLAGVEIGSNVLGTVTGAVRFLPLFQAAADAGLCVLVHAFHPPYWDCVADPPMAAAVNFPPEIGTSVAAMVANGFVEQSPGLRVCASHGGGTLPLHLPRMQAFWDGDPARAERGGSPYDSVRSMWFDSLTYEPAALRSLLDLVGDDRVVVGSDAPFFAEPPGYVVDRLHEVESLAPEVLGKIRTTNAVEFLGLLHAPGGTA
jgi:aminocarboxymuconate-semialdehyde decarboxylase